MIYYKEILNITHRNYQDIEKGRGSVIKLVCFGDSHVNAEHGFNEIAFQNGVTAINNSKADLALFLGDLTMEGTAAEYEYALKKFSSFKPEVYPKMLIGNHDARNVGYELFESEIGPRSYVIDDIEDLVVVVLDSTLPDLNTGRIGQPALDFAKKAFASYDDVVKVLTFHHHLLPIPNTGRERSMVEDAGDVLDFILRENIDIVCTAHRHFPNSYVITDEDGTALVLNAGTFSATKTRARAGCGFIKLEIDKKPGEKCQVQVYGYKTSESYDPIQEQHEIHQISRQFPIMRLDDKLGAKRLSRIVHLSDTHFTHGSEFRSESFEQALKLIPKENADIAIHTGDVTVASQIDEYELAVENLARLSDIIPLSIIPGHRDIWPIGKELFKKEIGPINTIWEDPQLRIMGYNTCRPYTTAGSLGRSKLNQIIEECGMYKRMGKFMIVATHHAAIPPPTTRDVATLEDAGEVIRTFVDSYIPFHLSGHNHSAFAVQVGNTLFCNAGTLSSSKMISLERLNSYNTITIYENGYVEIEEVSVNNGKRYPLRAASIPIPNADL